MPSLVRGSSVLRGSPGTTLDDCQLWLPCRLTLANLGAYLVRLEALQFGSRHDYLWVSAVTL
jgi:hypothetical protein